MNSDSLNMVSRLGEGHMPCTFFLSEPQLKTTVIYVPLDQGCVNADGTLRFYEVCYFFSQSWNLKFESTKLNLDKMILKL